MAWIVSRISISYFTISIVLRLTECEEKLIATALELGKKREELEREKSEKQSLVSDLDVAMDAKQVE